MLINVENYHVMGIPPFAFFAGIGFALSLICYLFLVFNYVRIDYKQILVWGFTVLGVVIGARLFGCFTNVFISLYNKRAITLDVVSKAGLVYYGGLFGSILFFDIGVKCFITSGSEMMKNAFSVVTPLFHSVSRVGCMFAGCCYGIDYSGPFAIQYERHGIISWHFPVQMTEAVLECLIFILLVSVFFRTPRGTLRNIKIRSYYLFFYATVRFVTEFFRGDEMRGEFGTFSFGQFISAIVIILLFIEKKRGTKEYE